MYEKYIKAKILMHHNHLQMPAAKACSLPCLLCRNPTPLDANIPRGACAAHTEQLPSAKGRAQKDSWTVGTDSGLGIYSTNLLITMNLLDVPKYFFPLQH